MYSRNQSGKAGSRRGKWSNCGRYWMERTSGNQYAQHAGPSVPYPVVAGPAAHPAPPGVLPLYYAGGQVHAPPETHVPPAPAPVPTTTPGPMQYEPVLNQWSPQPWGLPQQQPAPWLGNAPWMGSVPFTQMSAAVQPVQQPAQMAIQPQQPPAVQPNPHGFHGGHGGSSASSGGGKGPTVNNFPGPGNRAYFTKEYMEILENIKSNKAIDAAKKKLVGPRIGLVKRSGTRSIEPPDEGSGDGARSEKSDEMKAWVTTTLGDSLKLINSKLDDVDKKSKLDATEREELERLRREVQGGNKELSSNEKRKRSDVRTPMENSPSTARAKPRSKGSSKTKPKRIELSDDEGPSGTKQNLQSKLESTNNELSDIKRMLAALMCGLPDPKGKAKVVLREGKERQEEDDLEDGDVAQNAQVNGDEEDPDEDGFAAYMKVRAKYYGSLHYTQVQALCRERDVEYFKKDVAVWELARQDLQEYADSLREERGTRVGDKSRKKETPLEIDRDDGDLDDGGDDQDTVKGN
ncbi:hypothetical protein CBR_g17031 [Chara braunii]|uniref:Uncharacterized protein n=1 Tax=Chara braunii TaxID=69332 RepID=A0A388KUG9_CHABU|nr:hypothetical protein CBR_g17031 [Chara braunii]|eukprot:GBG73689.1 hypothetical protein CBR_g17031 [Chara braunii]